MDRWATFDCYGTLVDWNAGIGRELTRLLPGGEERLLVRYHEVEPQVQAAEPALPYREVMARVLEQLAEQDGAGVPANERDALARSLPSWPIFPEVPEALEELRRRGWKLGVLTNSDRDLIEASIGAIGVPFDVVVAAGEIHSYKPAHRHWEEFLARTGADPRGHVHVAQSHFHDIAPANELGVTSVWINRLGEAGEPRPTRELRDLSALPETLEELVPAAAS